MIDTPRALISSPRSRGRHRLKRVSIRSKLRRISGRDFASATQPENRRGFRDEARIPNCLLQRRLHPGFGSDGAGYVEYAGVWLSSRPDQHAALARPAEASESSTQTARSIRRRSLSLVSRECSFSTSRSSEGLTNGANTSNTTTARFPVFSASVPFFNHGKYRRFCLALSSIARHRRAITREQEVRGNDLDCDGEDEIPRRDQ